MYKSRFFFFFECNRLEVNSQVASAAARLLFGKTDASRKGFPLSWVKRPTLSHSGLVELQHLPPASAAPLAHPRGTQPKPPEGGNEQRVSIPLSQPLFRGISVVTSWDTSVCARRPCALQGCAAPASPVRGSAPGKGSLKAPGVCQMCAQCALCGSPARSEPSPLSQPPPLCQPINLPSARTPWFPGHSC